MRRRDPWDNHVITFLLAKFFNGTKWNREIRTSFVQTVLIYYFKRFIAQGVYTVCTRMHSKTFPVTNWNKYLHYGTCGTE